MIYVRARSKKWKSLGFLQKSRDDFSQDKVNVLKDTNMKEKRANGIRGKVTR